MGALFDISPEDRDNKSLLSYDNTNNKFKFRDVSSDIVLQRAAADQDLPDEFVSKIETSVDRDKITNTSYDAGTF